MPSSAKASCPVVVDRGTVRAARRLTGALLVLMAAQSSAGLLFPGQYRDGEWIKAAWFGNDWVTLAVATPLMAAVLVRGGQPSARRLLVWAGTVAYAIYNYHFYLFGAALSVFFPLYVPAVVLSIITLILLLGHADGAAAARRFRPETPIRTIGGFFVFVGGGLAIVWLTMWAAYVFADRPTPVDTAAFKIVAALDLALMVPALTCGGVLLWNRRPWGFVLASVAGLQGALYLIVLSVNSVVAIRRGLTAAPGELPFWAPLVIATSAATGLLLANVRDAPCESQNEVRS